MSDGQRPQGGLIRAGALAAVLLVLAAPVAAVLASLAGPYGDTIHHVMTTLGAQYAITTIALCATVGLSAGVVGVATAFVVATCDFPLRRVLSFALALPLAIPAYIAAYGYADLFGPYGALGTLGFSVRNLPGAGFVLAMTLYPYVYLTARAYFSGRSGALMEAARTLGAAPRQAAIRLLIPAARPAIAGGVALVMMETAADFGVADYYGVPTLSVGVFRTWHAFGDLSAAAQLASGLFALSALLVALEIISRRGSAAEPARISSKQRSFALKGLAGAGATGLCATPVFLGFAVPVAVIAAKVGAQPWIVRGLSDAFLNSAAIAGAGAVFVVLASVLLAYADRTSRGAFVRAAIRAASMGYAIPGAVIAIGVLSVFAALAAGAGAPLAATAGPVALLYAYLIRFLTAGYSATAAGLAAIDPAFDGAARTLGATAPRLIAKIHAPLLRPSLAAAATIVFVDIVKELPATLILRDFNFETLATRVYRLAGDERLAEAAPNALILIALGALPIVFLDSLRIRGQVAGERS